MKVFFDSKILQGRRCVPMLLPFLGRDESDPRDPLAGRFDKYCEIAPELFQPVSLIDCQIAVLPFDYGLVLSHQRERREVIDYILAAKEAGKRTLVFCWHDSCEELELPLGTIVYRTALRRSARLRSEHCMPSFCEDFVTKYANSSFQKRAYQARPLVSFRGRAAFDLSASDRLRRAARSVRDILRAKRRPFPYRETRQKAMRLLEQDNRIDTQFHCFQNFWGDLGDAASTCNTDDRINARAGYVESLFNSDYVLCIRGAGNFSMRLYETLCAGRIPLLLDTDSVFPFDDEVNWSDFALIIEEGHFKHIARLLVQFHGRLTDSAFIDRQLQCRRLWDDKISPHGFFKSIKTNLIHTLNGPA